MQIETAILLVVGAVAIVVFIAWFRRSTKQQIKPINKPDLLTDDCVHTQPEAVVEQASTLPLQMAAFNIPLPANADVKTVQFVIEFCELHLQKYELKAIFFFGSRATGIMKKGRTHFDDHDFVAVISDSAPDKIMTGGIEQSRLFSRLNSERSMCNLGPVDLLIVREQRFVSAGPDVMFIYSARTQGIKVYPQP